MKAVKVTREVFDIKYLRIRVPLSPDDYQVKWPNKKLPFLSAGHWRATLDLDTQKFPAWPIQSNLAAKIYARVENKGTYMLSADYSGSFSASITRDFAPAQLLPVRHKHWLELDINEAGLLVNANHWPNFDDFGEFETTAARCALAEEEGKRQ